MPKVLPGKAHYSISDPNNYYRDMREDVELLRDHQRFPACLLVILSCLDALAAGKGEATSGKFKALAEREFPELCRRLDGLLRGKSGADVLYDSFRNGFVHLRGPKANFAIADNAESDGEWAGPLSVEGKGSYFAINIERVIEHFLALINRLEVALHAT
jgi:hypothetical protein